MERKIVRQEDLARLLGEWLKKCELYAPVKRDNLAVFDRVHSASDVCLTNHNTTKPPKELLFPQSEALLTYSSSDDPASAETPLDDTAPRLLFGVRPCDARSLLLLDKVFDGERYKDVYYLNRRANTLIVSVGCVKPRSTCFCTSVGGGPFSSEGSDLLLIDIGDAYVVEVASNRGAELLEGSGLEEAEHSQLGTMQEVVRIAEERMAARPPLSGLQAKLEASFDDPVWGPLTEKCLGCGACTYLCPTCHCFDIVDEATDSRGARIRLWDSCQFSQFTLQASGFNPRPSTKERLRQRIMHKFCYFPENYGLTGCVGCGRCVAECPVNLDIRHVLDDILTEKVAR
jgi:ferredoxin